MRNPKIYTVPLRRKREGKTSYKRRKKLLLSGKTRLVVRKKSSGMDVSFVEFTETGDKTVVSASLSQLRKAGWKYNGGNMPAAYLIGYLAGSYAKKKNIKHAVLDAGLYTPKKKTRVYAALAGVIDAGVDIPHDDTVLPDKKRMEGAHIAAYSPKESGNQFSNYKKQSIDPSAIQQAVKDVKSKVTEK